MSEKDRKIIDLKSRSIHDNLMIHIFKRLPNENLIRNVPNAIKKEFEIDLKYVLIHHVGPPRQAQTMPGLNVGKMKNYHKKKKNPIK